MPAKSDAYYKKMEDERKSKDDESIQEAEYAKRYDRITWQPKEERGKKDLSEYYQLDEIIRKIPGGDKIIKKLRDAVDKKYGGP